MFNSFSSAKGWLSLLPWSCIFSPGSASSLVGYWWRTRLTVGEPKFSEWMLVSDAERCYVLKCCHPCSSELHDHFIVPSTGASDVSMSDVPGAKRQGGLWVSSHRLESRPLLRVSSGQPPGGQHLPHHRHLRVHRRPQEEQRQPGGSKPLPPHLGPPCRWEAVHLHLQGLPGGQL